MLAPVYWLLHGGMSATANKPRRHEATHYERKAALSACKSNRGMGGGEEPGTWRRQRGWTSEGRGRRQRNSNSPAASGEEAAATHSLGETHPTLPCRWMTGWQRAGLDGLDSFLQHLVPNGMVRVMVALEYNRLGAVHHVHLDPLAAILVNRLV